MKFTKFAIPLLAVALLLSALNGPVFAAEQGSITGNVYCDKDKNGTCDCEEAGLVDIHIQIFTEHCGGIPLYTVSSDKQGNFTFQGVAPGSYFIRADMDYVCGGRVPTTTNCQHVQLAAGEALNLSAFGYSEYGQ